MTLSCVTNPGMTYIQRLKICVARRKPLLPGSALLRALFGSAGAETLGLDANVAARASEVLQGCFRRWLAWYGSQSCRSLRSCLRDEVSWWQVFLMC